VATGVQVDFCDPGSPWQRATNEHTTGLLGQYFPNGSDLGVHDHDQAHLDAVAAELKGVLDRPWVDDTVRSVCPSVVMSV
jgi:IS30 family transposase